MSARTIINLVDFLSPVNFGIWHAAIATAGPLKEKYGIESILVAPVSDFPFPSDRFPDVKFISIENRDTQFAEQFLKKWNPATTIVATHGCWQFPTRWGAKAKSMGFKWVYTPHGMLEPWSMSQKWLKKRIYLELKEKPLAQTATIIRAVGSPEKENLSRWFLHVQLIPNGIYTSDIFPIERRELPIKVLFLARLHHKKGVMPMVEAWENSSLWKNTNYQLIIAGTDDGEQSKLEKFLLNQGESNIQFLGPAFGEDKERLMKSCHFYILPSVSEGFPTSVLEAMAAGLVPIITTGCNFPEAFAEHRAVETEPNLQALTQTFDSLSLAQEINRLTLARKNQLWVSQRYSWEIIADQQASLYFGLSPT